MAKQIISSETHDEERAFYHLTDVEVHGCIFAGPADGESALKESRDLRVRNCRFALRYPLWHVTDFSMEDCEMTEGVRAPLWYDRGGNIVGCTLQGVKGLRECEDIHLRHVMANSTEFGWKCRSLFLENCDISGEYCFLESQKIEASHLHLNGKYSFQYTHDVTITDSVLDTKDAFWHSENVTVKDSTVKGEYLGWYSRNLTLINCKITGTQPLCYCEGLTLVDCEMKDTDLCFEYSSVNADVRGTILSVKNPRSGKIVADGYGEIILGDAVVPCDCEIVTRS